jgi:stage V sporulation protein G
VEITDVRVFPVDDEKLKAYVSVVLDGCFMVNDIKVVSGRDGLFISMPSRKRKNGEYKDVAHPLNQETRRRFEERILAGYRIALGKADGVEAEIDGGVAAAVSESAAAGQLDGASDRFATAAATAACLLALPAQAPTSSLAELEKKHLDDRFWGVE